MAKGQIPTSAYTGRGIGVRFGETPVAVRFPAYLKAVLDSMGSDKKADFVRAAVVEKLEREALLPPVVVAKGTGQDQPKKSS